MAALTEDRDSERAYERDLITRFTTQYERRRQQEISQSKDAVPLDQQPLSVELVEFYARDNARTHHTESYELVHDSPNATPVFRRGLPFYFAVRFTRPFDPAVDNIVLQFNFGPKPLTTKGTRVVLPVTQQANLAEDKRLWDVRVHHQDGTTLTLQVQISTLSPVGVWKCNIISSLIAHPDVINDFKCSEDTYILFNPWCKEDQVYLEKEDLRREYVLNDSGKVWMGSARQPRGRRWVFGHFDDAVLPAVALLLEKSNLPHSERGNPIAVSRAISAVVNCNDEQGLVYGRWVNNYSGGTHPDAWTGSVAILEEFLKTGGRPVRYGQCWVFSACTVTVCRALGLPCRSVTNYVSAHDTNHSLTVDKYFTREGEEMIRGPDGNCRDSCWNYHTWNDVWMSRPDLPPGYGGWQVIDATPQEKSDNLYRCGPASVEAVRRGEVGFLHDTPFVFAEVNADLCHFMEDRNSDWGFSRLYINHYHVGQRIVTKSVDKDDDEGDTDFEDVTHLYKDSDGSQAERLAVMNAVRLVPGAQKLYALPPTNAHDVDFDLVEVDSVPLGQPFSVNVHIHNKSEQPRTILAMLSANSVQYTGATAYRLKRATGEFVVEANQRETLRIQVTPAEYLDKLVDHSLVKIYAIASVKETRQTWSEEDDFPLTKPKLSVQIRGSTQVGQTSQATFSFQNPLNSLLTNCVVSFEGPGLNRPKLVAHRDVKPGELISFTENFRPKRAGEKKLVGAFNSKQLSQVVGSITINVLP